MFRMWLHKRVFQRDEKGISVLELMIGGVIGALVLGAGTLAVQQLERGRKRADQNLSSNSLEAIGNRQLWMDGRRAGVSFNLLNIASDFEANNPQAPGGNFYDFLPDFNCSSKCGRRILMVPRKAVGDPAPKEFVLAVTQGGLSKPVALRPSTFFTLGSASVPAKGLPPIKAANLNKDSFSVQLKNHDPDPNGPGSITRPGQLLWFFSPISTRFPAVGGSLTDMNEPPERLSFVGVVKNSGGTIEVDPFKLTGVIDGTTRPGPGTGPGINSVSDFFKWLPPVGGGNAFAMVLPISIVRYQLGKGNLNGREVDALYRDTYDAGANKYKDSPQLVAMPIASVEVSRSSISSASIKAKIKMVPGRQIGGQSDEP